MLSNLRVSCTARALALICSFHASVHAASQIQIAFDSGSQFVLDQSGDPLTAGTLADGDGAIIQLGFYDAAAAGNNFAGTWHALTGLGSLNTGGNTGSGLAFNTTSIGDIGGGASPGVFGFSLVFDNSVTGTFNDLPSSTSIPLAIRFYDKPTLAGSSFFNTVSNDAWLWKQPGNPSPLPPTIAMSLDDSGLRWHSIAVAGQPASSAFRTSVAIVPEPSTAGLLALAIAALGSRRRRR